MPTVETTADGLITASLGQEYQDSIKVIRLDDNTDLLKQKRLEELPDKVIGRHDQEEKHKKERWRP